MHIRLNSENDVITYLKPEEVDLYKKRKKKDKSIVEISGDKVPSIGARYEEETGHFTSYAYDHSERGKRRKRLKGLLRQYDTENTTPVDITAPFSDTNPMDSIKETDFWDEEKEYNIGDIVRFADTKYLEWMEVNNVNRFMIDTEFYKTGNQSLKIMDRKQSCGGMDIPYRDIGIEPGGRYRISVTFSPTGKSALNLQNEERYMQCHLCCNRGELFDFVYGDHYAETWSSGQTLQGEWETVELELDLTQEKELPGVMRIQTCNGSDPLADFYIDEIKVVDLIGDDVIHDLKFNMHSYKSRKKNSNKNPVDNLNSWEGINRV